MSSQTITVPDIGGAEGVEIIEVCIAAGDTVAPEQSLIVLETDKASVEVPSPFAGQIKQLSVEVGQKVSEGDVICTLVAAGESEVSVTDSGDNEPAPEPPAPTHIAATNALSAKVETVVPDGVESAEVIEVSLSVGDEINEGDTVAVLETDKATVDVPATAAGKVEAVAIAVGDKLNSGDVVATLISAQSAHSTATAPAAPVTEPEPESTIEPAVAAGPLIATVPDGAEDVEVIEISVSVGDVIAEGDGLAVLETDKATVDVPANAAGKVTSVLIEVGQKVSSGDPVVELAGQAKVEPIAASATEPAPTATSTATNSVAAAPTLTASSTTSSTPAPDTQRGFSRATEVYAGPAVRTHARLLGVDLKDIKPTGPRGRILKEDVDNYVKQIVSQKDKPSTAATGATPTAGIPPMPAVDFSAFGEIETQAMSKIQKLTALNMHRNWLHVPAVTQFDDADITDLEAFRKSLKSEGEKRGVKLTPLPFLLKAVAAALKAEPKFNSSLGPDGASVVYKKYCHIGIAADTPLGLLVPVIRDVDKKGLWELAEEANALVKKARDGKLSLAEMQGGCFTISSLGAIGGTGFTPIVNAPEVAILGVSKAEMKPVWNGQEFVPRNKLPLSLSYDHRVINGADGGRFFTYLISVLSDVRRLLL